MGIPPGEANSLQPHSKSLSPGSRMLQPPAAPLPLPHPGPVSLSPWLPPCFQGSACTGAVHASPVSPQPGHPHTGLQSKKYPHAYPRQPCCGEARAGAGLPEEPTSPGHISETAVRTQLQPAGGNSPLIITHSCGGALPPLQQPWGLCLMPPPPGKFDPHPRIQDAHKRGFDPISNCSHPPKRCRGLPSPHSQQHLFYPPAPQTPLFFPPGISYCHDSCCFGHGDFAAPTRPPLQHSPQSLQELLSLWLYHVNNLPTN